MQIKTIILGTAGSAPTRERRMPSVAMIYEGEVLLFDCGEGTQFRMLEHDINPVKVKAIFISHAHGDHTIGIAGLVRTMGMNNRKEPLLIFVPAGDEKVIQSLITFDRALITYKIIIRGIRSGLVYSGREYEVLAFKLRHTIPTYGYAFREKSKTKFKKELAHRLGIRGEMFSKLEKNGSVKVGKRTVRLSQVSWRQEGKKIVYATDTRPTQETIAAARNADLLIHESSYKASEIGLARKRMHSSAGEVAMLAKKAGVKRLVLTHISARHRTDTELLRDARNIFKNTVVANDGYTVII
ncbi:MAG: ribonuclease Z [Candidatus Micrarchaeota archaeon]|nr:ribonuclease Z [Candidatus Micrarchaeota archaeon]